MAKRKQYFTPIGVFAFCHLNKPDTKFNAAGEFKVQVAYDKDDPEVEQLINQLKPLHEEAWEQAKEKFGERTGKTKADHKKAGITKPTLHDFYNDEYDDEGEPTGRIIFNFKTKASFTDKKGNTIDKVVPLIDGKGQMISAKKRPLVYAGTQGRIAFATGCAYIPKGADAYLSFYLNQVQITELVTSGGGASAFGAVEGSEFDGDDLDVYEGKSDDDAEGGGDQNDGDEGGLDDDEIPF